MTQFNHYMRHMNKLHKSEPAHQPVMSSRLKIKSCSSDDEGVSDLIQTTKYFIKSPTAESDNVVVYLEDTPWLGALSPFPMYN